MLETYLLGIAAVVGLTLGWVAVQQAWGRVFPDASADVDVLARRLSCHGCGCSTVCERQRGKASDRGDMQ